MSSPPPPLHLQAAPYVTDAPHSLQYVAACQHRPLLCPPAGLALALLCLAGGAEMIFFFNFFK